MYHDLIQYTLTYFSNTIFSFTDDIIYVDALLVTLGTTFYIHMLSLLLTLMLHWTRLNPLDNKVLLLLV